MAGVLGMHALAPGFPPAHAVGHDAARTHAVAAGEGCSDTAGGSGHADHADATCAATGISTAYIPPALVATLIMPVPAGVPAGVVAEGGVSGRAPPDLAELQLLRI
ncbi:DUF6153 family protein [Streptomyces sp. H27-H1]|uniref:DUF6153 family protein n=1 Tax=Streptomyces sp. H27-H1 TaxID=2996461 RepID=UPI0022706F2F|nr:DUF6153 family protein [Streptomyces sp. H27-H1]MCY0932477.1 DUF6153 family protein [Streptomyces sp. H27-H1]